MKRKSENGQTLIEFILGLLLLILPIISGIVAWYNAEWSRIKCTRQVFSKARTELIQTHQPVHLSQQCGNHFESINLVSLENLDGKNGSGLDLGDGVKGVSQYLEDASRLASSLHRSDSSD